MRAGKIDHDFLFFKANGQPLRNLLYPGKCWHRTLSRLKNIRYRRPYTARHTSVSWDLMIGRSALWVARQHGHSISTMLRFYAAWSDGAGEHAVDTIRATLNSERRLRRKATIAAGRTADCLVAARPFEMEMPPRPGRFASEFATGRDPPVAKSLKTMGKIGGERGIRTLDGLLAHTPLAGARLRPLGHLSGQRSAGRQDDTGRREGRSKNADSGSADPCAPGP